MTQQPRIHREETAAEALSVFGVAPFVDFLRTIREDSPCTAVRLANEALDSGDSIQDLFFTGEGYGFHLTVEKAGDRRFLISFGYLAGPLAGDGGEWDVVVDGDRQIVKAVREGYWIS